MRIGRASPVPFHFFIQRDDIKWIYNGRREPHQWADLALFPNGESHKFSTRTKEHQVDRHIMAGLHFNRLIWLYFLMEKAISSVLGVRSIEGRCPFHVGEDASRWAKKKEEDACLYGIHPLLSLSLSLFLCFSAESEAEERKECCRLPSLACVCRMSGALCCGGGGCPPRLGHTITTMMTSMNWRWRCCSVRILAPPYHPTSPCSGLAARGRTPSTHARYNRISSEIPLSMLCLPLLLRPLALELELELSWLITLS